MTEQRNFTNEIAKLYPPPEKPSRTFTPEDVSALENALGIEFPSDYIDFLRLYGHGSFENYVYINYPFGENAPENFIAETERRRENYRMLEKTRIEAETFPGDKPILWVDCIFQGGELAVTGGNPDMAVYLGTEKIDLATTSPTNSTRKRAVLFSWASPMMTSFSSGTARGKCPLSSTATSITSLICPSRNFYMNISPKD